MLQLADIDLADEGRDVLVVLVTGFGLGDADLLELRRIAFDDAELADIAAIVFQPLDRPRTKYSVQVAARNIVFLLQDIRVLRRIEQPQRALVDRGILQGIEGDLLHQGLQALGDRRLAAADRSQQVQHLLLFLEPLGGMAEIGDDLLDHLFHAVEFPEGRVNLDDLVGEQSREPGIGARVDRLRLTDRHQHPLCRRGVGGGVLFTKIEVFAERKFFFASLVKTRAKILYDVHGLHSTDDGVQETCRSQADHCNSSVTSTRSTL